MNLWILHADTPYRMYREHRYFSDPALHINNAELAAFGETRVAMAFWADHRLNDNAAWEAFLAMRADACRKLRSAKNLSFLFCVEDLRILLPDPLPRLCRLQDEQIRILTPFWQGENRLGGAYDSSAPLSQEGKELLNAALSLGFLLDVSHAGHRSFWGIAEAARSHRVPLLATHSNFSAVCPHTRNISDAEALAVKASDGLIGLSLVPAHLGNPADESALLRHIDHGLTLGLEDTLALGCDFDGTDSLACGFSGVSDLFPLYRRLAKRYDTHFLSKLYFENAERVLGGYLASSLTSQQEKG